MLVALSLTMLTSTGGCKERGEGLKVNIEGLQREGRTFGDERATAILIRAKCTIYQKRRGMFTIGFESARAPLSLCSLPPRSSSLSSPPTHIITLPSLRGVIYSPFNPVRSNEVRHHRSPAVGGKIAEGGAGGGGGDTRGY